MHLREGWVSFMRRGIDGEGWKEGKREGVVCCVVLLARSLGGGVGLYVGEGCVIRACEIVL